MLKNAKIRIAILASIILIGGGASARADGFSLGLEGYGDHYKEPGPDLQVDNHAVYGGVTAAYELSNQSSFWTIEGRADYGSDDYSSVDGSSNNTPQYDTEVRLRGGPLFSVAGGSLAPYLGLGGRFYFDQGTGTSTNLGFGGYDRYIEQLYLPVGASWGWRAGNWTITPTAEYDQLLYGRVWSKLDDFVGYNVWNTQSDGYGLRGSLMFGTQMGKYHLEIGPFARYWSIKDSSETFGPDGTGWVEPHNTRLQAGAQARLLFW